MKKVTAVVWFQNKRSSTRLGGYSYGRLSMQTDRRGKPMFDMKRREFNL
jgi:hypothetical protein